LIFNYSIGKKHFFVNNQNMTIIVLHGGVSGEREVSIMSGINVADALTKMGHTVNLVDVKSELDWVSEDGTKFHFDKVADLKADLIFNALHGKFGEDGQVQAMLDILKVPYTGSDVLASALGINKAKCYEILEKFDIDIPKTYEIKNLKEIDYLDLPFPLFVKPNDGGSSVATGRANNQEELFKLVQLSQSTSSSTLIQELVEGDEVTCPVLGSGGHAYALPVGMIKTENTFFDYDAKYNSDATIETFPAPIAEKDFKKIQEMSLEIHRLLDCKGISRSDFIITKDRIVFLEINTSPGMTKTSLCPKAALAAGLSFEQLLNQIILDTNS
jgi:D-alanine-D-alanine ligase